MCKAVFAAAFVVMAVFSFAETNGDALGEYRAGRYQSAVDICIAEIAETPANMDAHVVLCWSLVSLSRYAEAARYAERGWNVNRYDPRIVEVLAEAWYYQGRNEESLKLFQEYINLAPEGSRVDVSYYFMGELYIRLARFHHADIAFSTAVMYVPRESLWWTRLAYAREQAGDSRNAVAAYEKALSLNPQSQDAKLGLERTRASTR